MYTASYKGGFGIDEPLLESSNKAEIEQKEGGNSK